MTVGFFRQFN